MTTVLRFAPSPTGKLHVGNLRAALMNWLAARQSGGRFILRLDDTDTDRSTEENAQAILTDMRWLGLHWDESFRQSERMARYADVAEDLKRAGRLYACYETPDELSLKRKTQASRGLPQVYDRAALHLSAEDRAALEAEGRRPHWRFLLIHEPIRFEDAIHGPLEFQGAALSDPVLIREDGRPLYTLSSCIDDVDTGVTQIIRGDDHITNTATQVQLIQALGGSVPRFGHFPLISGAEGEKLSKRLASLALWQLREAGVEPLALCSLMARLGTSKPVEARASLMDLAAEFRLEDVSRNPPRFDEKDLWRLNAQLLHQLGWAEVRPRLEALGLLERMSEARWLALRSAIDRLQDLPDWLEVLEGEAGEVAPEEQEFLAVAADLLPAEPWDAAATWSTWSEAVKARTGRKGKALFRPLRLALTGQEHGPELAPLLPLIGRDRVAARLRRGG